MQTKSRPGRALLDVAVTGPGSSDIARLLERAPGLRTAAWLEALPPAGVAHVVVACVEPRGAVPDLGRYASGQPLLVVLIDRPDDAVVLAMLRAGASGMLVRGEFTRSDLLAAITGARHGEVHLSPSVATMVVHALRTLRPPAETSSHAVLSTLSAAETRLLDLLATGASNGSISEQLRVAPQTVRNRVSTLYARLGVRSRAEAIALRLG